MGRRCPLGEASKAATPVAGKARCQRCRSSAPALCQLGRWRRCLETASLPFETHAGFHRSSLRTCTSTPTSLNCEKTCYWHCKLSSNPFSIPISHNTVESRSERSIPNLDLASSAASLTPELGLLGFRNYTDNCH